MKDENKVKQGKSTRAAGKAFELKVRHKLESEGWIVDRWTNNIEFTDTITRLGKLVPAKPKFVFNPVIMRRVMLGMQSGFPDFVCIKPKFDVQFVESKMTGKIDRIEKDKIEWIKNNLKIPVIIASKGIKRGEINYEQT